MTSQSHDSSDDDAAPAEPDLDLFLEQAFKAEAMPQESPGADPPRTIGGHEVLARVGHGGMGIVLRGRDRELDREVALKILKPRYASDPALVRRFMEEARIGARLQHPGIVPIYRIGTDECGEPYFTMKLIDGRSLAALLADRRSLDDERLELLSVFLKTCQAVAFAHARGIVHRDLKPSNVMVGDFGEVHLVDWGLAKVLAAPEPAPKGATSAHEASDSAFRALRIGTPPASSQAGEVIGTLAYMAPEQARGATAGVDARADVFSLGGILCEILTGEPPYTGVDRAQVRERAARAVLAPAIERLQRAGVDAGLAALARSCLAADPDARPRDAGELARALEGWFAAVEARARDAELAAAQARTRTEQAALQASVERRARRTTTALAAVTLLAVLGGGASYLAVSNDRRLRAASTESVISAALEEAAVLRSQALAGTLESLSLWSRADSALSRAASAAEAGGAPPRRLEQIAARQRELESERERAESLARGEQADREVVASLERAREDFAGHFRSRVLREDTQAALRSYGIDVEALSTEEAAARIAESRVSRALLDALDYCAGHGLGAPEPKRAPFQRLLEIAQLADEDAVRVELRSAILERDAVALRRIAESEDVTRLAASALDRLCDALALAGDSEAARACLLRALALHPGDFWLCHAAVGQLAASQSIEYGRACVALRPRSPAAWTALGTALAQGGGLEEGCAALQRVVELDPDAAVAQRNLALALHNSGAHAAAVEPARRALELGAEDGSSQQLLLTITVALGDAEVGVRTYLELAARFDAIAAFHSGLAYWLEVSGDLEGSVREYERSIELDPAGAAIRLCSLARPLRGLGRFRAAAEALLRGFELGRTRPDWRGPPADLLEEYRALAELETKLEAVLAGQRSAASAEECVEFARMCEFKRMFAAEARFYAMALEEPLALTGAGRSELLRSGAQAVLRASAGEGVDRGAGGAAAAARAKALDWLREDLEEQARHSDHGEGHALEGFEAFLRDAEMQRLCSEAATASWSEADRAALEALLDHLERLRSRPR